VTVPALPLLPDETRPPKVRVRPAAALLDPAILRTAVWQALVKLNPRSMIRIPVMFLVEVGSVITAVEFAAPPRCSSSGRSASVSSADGGVTLSMCSSEWRSRA
jgi:hypothetical protein